MAAAIIPIQISDPYFRPELNRNTLMHVKTYGSAVYGISAQAITVEVDVGKGAKAQIIGLPDNAVKESLTRVYAALKNSGYLFPRQGLIVNMAPADIKKEGSSYDLTIALGIMAASGQIDSQALEDTLIMGELALDGSLLPIKGCLPMAIQAQKDGMKRMLIPIQNGREAAIVQQVNVYGFKHLDEVVAFLQDPSIATPLLADPRSDFEEGRQKHPYDFNEVKGQESIKRAMQICRCWRS